jgi:hypothetical protein
MKSRPVSLSIIILIIIIVLAVIAGIFLLSGGIASPFSFNPPKNAGAVPVTDNSTPQKIGLNTAFSYVSPGFSKFQSDMPETRIFSATGLLLDYEGKADSWLFIARQSNVTKFIEINGRGINANSWSGIVPNTEIDPRNVVLPEDLFRTQQSRLQKYIDEKWEFYSIELKNNNYTLTLKKGPAQKIFVFRAVNGELIQG